jgi:hypothetical protein
MCSDVTAGVRQVKEVNDSLYIYSLTFLISCNFIRILKLM